MKKGLIGILIATCLMLAPVSYAKADIQLDRQYKEAYDSTMNVVNIANKYGVRPFWKLGQCEYDDVIKAIEEGKIDKEIFNARDKIGSLPPSVQINKNTLSEILDNYQHQLYYQVIYGLSQMDTAVLHANTDGSSLEKYNSINYCQGLIMKERVLIENMKDEFKNSYRTAIDERQQGLINALVNLIDFSKTANDPSYKYYSVAAVNVVEYYTKNDKVLQDFLSPLFVKANSLEVGHVISDDEILGFALKNGFTEVAVDEDAIYEGEKAYKLLVNEHGDGIEFYKEAQSVIFKCKKSSVDSRDKVLSFMVPNHKEFLVSCANSRLSDIYAAQNGFIVKLTTNGDFNTFKFYRCYLND